VTVVAALGVADDADAVGVGHVALLVSKIDS